MNINSINSKIYDIIIKDLILQLQTKELYENKICN